MRRKSGASCSWCCAGTRAVARKLGASPFDQLPLPSSCSGPSSVRSAACTAGPTALSCTSYAPSGEIGVSAEPAARHCSVASPSTRPRSSGEARDLDQHVAGEAKRREPGHAQAERRGRQMDAGVRDLDARERNRDRERLGVLVELDFGHQAVRAATTRAARATRGALRCRPCLRHRGSRSSRVPAHKLPCASARRSLPPLARSRRASISVAGASASRARRQRRPGRTRRAPAHSLRPGAGERRR